LAQCGTPVAEVQVHPSPAAKFAQTKVAGSYVDTLPSQFLSDGPDASITYAVEVLNTGGRSAGLSNPVRVPLVRTLSPPQDFSARVTGQGVVLTWTSNLPPAVAVVHYVYRVYRRPEVNQHDVNQQQTLLGELTAGSNRSVTLVDSNIEWDRTYEYRAEAVTVVTQPNKPEVQVEGEASHEVKVFALDVFPPAVPSGLQAVFSGPGQKPFIDLIWAPVTDVDLDGYNVYRREEAATEDGAAAVKLNAELLKTPAYRDDSVVPGKNYLYSVSAVDVRGNESARSEEAGETVP
jgi:hypothetical protein